MSYCLQSPPITMSCNLQVNVQLAVKVFHASIRITQSWRRIISSSRTAYIKSVYHACNSEQARSLLRSADVWKNFLFMFIKSGFLVILIEVGDTDNGVQDYLLVAQTASLVQALPSLWHISILSHGYGFSIETNDHLDWKIVEHSIPLGLYF